jgi:hypothetical protein
MSVNSGTHHRPTPADIAKNAQRLFNSLNLDPSTSTLVSIVRLVVERFGKPIAIEPIGDRGWATVTGLWVDTPGRHRILIRKTDTPLYQRHVVLHELAHILFEHPGCKTARATAPAIAVDLTSAEVRARKVIATSSSEAAASDAVLEGEAEQLAFLLSRVLLRPKNHSDERVFG